MNRLIKNGTLLSFLTFTLLGLSGCSKTLTAAEAKEYYQRQNPGIFFYELYNFQTDYQKVEDENNSHHQLIQLDRENGNYYIYTLTETVEDGVSSKTETIYYQVNETTGRLIQKADDEPSTTSDVDIQLVVAAVDAEFKDIAENALFDYSELFEEVEGITKTFTQEADSSIKVVTSGSDDQNNSYTSTMVFTGQSLFSNSTLETTTSDGNSIKVTSVYTYNANFKKITSL